jgi:hypothetical protein
MGDAKWGKWTLEIYRRAARVPPASVAEAFSQLSRVQQLQLGPEIQELVRSAATNELTAEETASLSWLKAIQATLPEATR